MSQLPGQEYTLDKVANLSLGADFDLAVMAFGALGPDACRDFDLQVHNAP